MEFTTFILTNGIRVIFKPISGSDVAHCGFVINAGTRDEAPNELGMAHFLEHVLFKGTRKRKAFHILNRLDAVGGELNAYTTKEDTCIYASFLHHHFERAVELLADITFHSIFPPKELDKEKDVVIEEIRSYQDSPSEQIFDDFEELVFSGHPIGYGILGKEDTLREFQQADVVRFFQRHYTSHNLVFSIVGDLPLKKVKLLAEKYLGDLAESSTPNQRQGFDKYRPQQKKQEMEVFQAHCMLGTTAYSVHHKDRRSMVLLNNILGGPGSNCRLNLNIREKYGFTYHIESNYTPYSDSGIFSVYLGTDPQSLDRTLQLVHRELRKLREKQLGVGQLHSAKQQLIGQIALSQESRSSLMMAMGKSLLTFDRVATLPEIYAEIEAISAEELLRVANEILTPDRMSLLTFVPKN
ncbi:MAG: M16 family metallopeptidase [Salibacteraceae bacterium]